MRRLRPALAAAVAIGAALGGALVPGPASAQAPATSPWLERRVLNVAHAGGDLEAPHSTLYAMRTAVAAGTDVLELDVRLSSDGVLMVQHDDTVDRTTGATGPVASRTSAELQALDNAYWFVPGCWSCHDRPASAYTLRGIRTGSRPAPAGFTADDFAIPTLQEVADAFPDRILDVEIKDGPQGMAGAEALAAFIAADGRTDRYLVASFDDAILAHFKSLAPAVATSPGLGELTTWFLGVRGPMPQHQVLQVPPTFSGIEVVSRQFVDDAHAAGLAVWVWFNGNDDDAPAEWQRLLDLGVDALLTGKPAAAQQVIDADAAAFRAAPLLPGDATIHRKVVTVEVTCPALHVETCRGYLAVVARDRRGTYAIAGAVPSPVPRGTTTTVDIPITKPGPGWRRATWIVFVATDGDTLAAGGEIDISRG